jgi:predicted helicase
MCLLLLVSGVFCPHVADEIIRFIIEGADCLVDRHFGKTLGDLDVEILDPCTLVPNGPGPGKYLCNLCKNYFDG